MVDVKAYYAKIEKTQKELEEKITSRNYDKLDIDFARCKIEDLLCSILYEYVLQKLTELKHFN